MMLSARLILILGLLSCTACGGLHVDPLSLTDPRLPVDARRWVADAEDAVVVSRARRDESARVAKDIVRWQQAVLTAAPFTGSKGADAKRKRDELGLDRIGAASAAYRLTEAELALSKARLQLIYAETAMRQDIAVYDMPPLQAAVDKALQSVIVHRDLHRRARETELKTTDAWWSAWQNMAKSKSDTRPFWTVSE
jgi:hypothetical protein